MELPATRFTLAAETTAPPVPGHLRITDSIEPAVFMGNVEKALQYIRIGDIYQVQLGHELTITSTAHPFDVYRRLRVRNPSPYMFLAPFGDLTVVGASPEFAATISAGYVVRVHCTSTNWGSSAYRAIRKGHAGSWCGGYG